jgi:hypothetical protein
MTGTVATVGGRPTWYAEYGDGDLTSYVLFMEKPALVTQLALDFLTTDPVPTIMPIRRA